jgi:hypothetical protein
MHHRLSNTDESRRRKKTRLLALATFGLTLLVLTPVQSAFAGSNPKFTLTPNPLTMSAPAGTITYAYVTVTNTSGRPLVIDLPASVHNDQTNPDGIHTIFSDSQGGSCWQAYEALGNPIPGHGTCTIQVSFLPGTTGSYTGTLTTARCTSWTTDPTFGFIVCSAFDGSRTINLAGTGT